MARTDSINILLTDEGNDKLAEAYGKVVANVQKRCVSQALKNTDLSGTPGAGSYECKRFANRTSDEYGTARSGGKGQSVKADPVVVSIDTRRELVTEVEQHDVTLYGVDHLVSRQSEMDEKSMQRELERAFFAEAVSSATAVTPASGAGACDGAAQEERDRRGGRVMEIDASLAQTRFNLTRSPGRAITHIVCRYTATNASAENNCRYFGGGDLGKSADFFIDLDGSVRQFNADCRRRPLRARRRHRGRRRRHGLGQRVRSTGRPPGRPLALCLRLVFRGVKRC